MKKMLLVLNPRSGTRKANKVLPEIISIFNRADYLVTVHITTGPEDCAKTVAQLANQMDMVVCCGGDGTFNETVNGLLQNGTTVPIGYIPCGSTNDFAASLRLPADLLEAAQAIADGSAYPYDVGMANGHYFTYVASFGAFTKSSYATNQTMKNSFGFLAYFLSGIQEISQIHPIPIRIELDDGEVIEDPVLFGAISNSTRLGRVLNLDTHQVDMADGKLELMLIRPPKDLFELSTCIHKLQNQQYDHRMITFRSVEHLRITCPSGTIWTLDGERFDPCETLQIQNCHHAIRLIQKGTP